MGRTTDKRTEILDMIARLRASRAEEDRERRTPKLRTDRPAARSARLTRPPGAPSLPKELALTLQALNLRISRLEEQVSKKPSSAPPPPASTAPADSMFSGILKGQMLSDMLQLVSSNQMSGIFVIDSEVGNCTLYFFEGRIRHAVGEGVTGEEAFFAAFASQEGRYHFTETVDLPPDITVSSGTQFLVLEALRRMDETSGG